MRAPRKGDRSIISAGAYVGKKSWYRAVHSGTDVPKAAVALEMFISAPTVMSARSLAPGPFWRKWKRKEKSFTTAAASAARSVS